jgi:endonuclease YncB( thermonuclease family)
MRALALVALLLPSVALADVTGPATVADADTLTIEGEEISLYGIDALEITQSCAIDGESWFCGWDAANRLEEVIGDREVVCVAAGEADAEGVTPYRCMAGEDDLAGVMLDEGFAIVVDDTDDTYREREMAASEAGAGMWAGTFTEPATFRDNDCGCTARKKAMQETAAFLKEQRDAEEAGADDEEASN